MESGGGVCAGDVIADLSQVCRVETWRVTGVSGQAELVSEMVGECLGVGLRVPGGRTGWPVVDVYVEVGVGRIVGMDDVDQ